MVTEISAKERIYDSICLIPGQSTKDIADYLEMSYGSVRTVVWRLKNEGKVSGNNGKWYEVGFVSTEEILAGFQTSPTQAEPVQPKLRLRPMFLLVVLPLVSYLVGRYA